MSETTPPTDVSHYNELDEQDPVIGRNLRLLERAYIPNTPALADSEEEELGRYYLSTGERRVVGENALMSSIHIRYDTRTGNIIKPNYDQPGIKDGDSSILRTYLISDGEKIELNEKLHRWDTTPGTYKILLAYPDGWLNPHALQAAVNQQYGTGDGVDPLQGEGNWILPERIIPEDVKEHGSSIMGPSEPWGQSRFMDKPADMVIFRSIEAFNKKHGPSLSEQFFRKVDIQAQQETKSPHKILELLSRLKNRFSPKK